VNAAAQPLRSDAEPRTSDAPLLANRLRVSLGQYSTAGRKPLNQDFHGAYLPEEPQLTAKGIALALADGISTSNVSHIASQTAVKSFFEDYFCTSPAWSTKQSGQRVLAAINAWLYSQTKQSQFRYDQDRGYVCTIIALVLKGTTAHIFHAGDSRVLRMRDDTIEQLTDDHRVWLSQDESYLARALGVQPHLDIDYRAIAVDVGDVFVIASDGVHEFIDQTTVQIALEQHPQDLDTAAQTIVAAALERGSDDNLTVQLLRVDALPEKDARALQEQLIDLPFPPELTPRMAFDGYTIVRELHASHRSHVHLAIDDATSQRVAIKTLSTELREDRAALERFLLEDWIAQRINNPHVVRAIAHTRKRHFLYTVTEFVEGTTLAQRLHDDPRPSLDRVRDIVEQLARGLTAFHRLEMLHQDLRPANVMIDATGTVKIVDFGSTRVAGLVEDSDDAAEILGTAQYTAPEYFIGEAGTTRSDLFSLGVIAYEMLSGRLPFGDTVAKARTRMAQQRLIYRSVLSVDRQIPAWIDDVLRKATHPDPNKRYAELSEFVYELRHPNPAYLTKTRPPLIERNPVGFWRTLAIVFLLLSVYLLATR